MHLIMRDYGMCIYIRKYEANTMHVTAASYGLGL